MKTPAGQRIVSEIDSPPPLTGGIGSEPDESLQSSHLNNSWFSIRIACVPAYRDLVYRLSISDFAALAPLTKLAFRFSWASSMVKSRL